MCDEMNIKWSFFPTIRDVQPSYEEMPWSDACMRLRDWSRIPRPPSSKTDGIVPVISPALFRTGATRRKDAVLCWHFAAFDIDNDHQSHSARFEDVVELVGELPHILHSTTKSKPDHHRMRLILPLSRPVDVSEFDHFWAAADQWSGRIFDHRTRDPSRVFFIPAAWGGADNRFAERLDGVPLNVDALMAAFPMPTVTTMAPVSFTNTSWALAPLCADPMTLVTDEMEQEYLTAPVGSGRFFKFLCRVAARARFLNVSIMASDLESLALAMDRTTGTSCRVGTLREAERALAFIASQPDPEPFHKDARFLHRIRRLQARAKGGAA